MKVEKHTKSSWREKDAEIEDNVCVYAYMYIDYIDYIVDIQDDTWVM